jgi:predicted dehydrogenase
MQVLGIGVVGCGFVGRGAHVPGLSALECAKVAAVADPDPTRLEKVAAKHHVESRYTDYRRLIDDPAIEAVVVATPTPLHAPVALAAIEAGKHVLCEMPLASTIEEAEKIIEAAEVNDVTLMPGLTFRFTPNYVKVKQLLQQGSIGRATAVHYREFIPASDLASQWPANSWVWQFDQSGGPLFTLSVWSIDLVAWLLDAEIDEVQASTRYTRLEQLCGTLGYDACATLRLGNGCVASMQFSGSVARSAAGSSLKIIGDSNKLLRANDNDRVTLLGDDPAKTEWDVRQPGPMMWGHQQQDEHFVRSILAGRRPDIVPADGRRAMEVALKIAQAGPREFNSQTEIGRR